jgi:predicted nucleic acid-binding protein
MAAASDGIACDTGALTALDACEQVELLRALYARVVVSQVVERELAVGGPTGFSHELGEQYRAWIKIHSVSGPLVAVLTATLDEGEASTIALALELGSPTFSSMSGGVARWRAPSTFVRLEALPSCSGRSERGWSPPSGR